MKARTRLAELEARAGALACPACGADGSETDPPRVRRVAAGIECGPCSECGRMPRVIRARPMRIGTPEA